MDTFELPAYLVGLLAAFCFAILARRFEQRPVPLALIGGSAVLFLTATLLGLANAIAVPYTPSIRERYAWAAVALAVFVVAAVVSAIILFRRRRFK